LAEEGVVDSIDKLTWLHQVAATEAEDDSEDGDGDEEKKSSSSSSSCINRRGKIYTGPVLLQLPRSSPDPSLPLSFLLLVPLLSWYHPSWDTEPDLPTEVLAELYDGRPAFEQRWADFRFCKWPEEVVERKEGGRQEWGSITTKDKGIAEWFAEQNEGFLKDTRVRLETREGGNEGRAKKKVVVISFSHFLPREELCPEKRFLIEPLLPKVIGSQPLREQVERLKPDLHLFGHTHIPVDMEVGGIRYLQWPLGSVGEQGRQTGEMSVKGPVVVFDSKGGGGVQGEVPTRWGAHYKEEGRDVLNTELAPWVKMYWSQR